MRATWRKWLGFLLFLILCAVVMLRLFASPPAAVSDYDTIKATMLKVGKADAIIVESPFMTMVIDAGEEDDGPELVAYLKNRSIEKVDVLIVTHFDKDHVGGADTLVESVPVDRVIMPDYESQSTEYLDFLAALEAKGIVPERLRESVTFPFGDGEVLVEPPLTYDLVKAATHDSLLEIDNDLSLITTITHGDNRLVFTGDAEKIRLREWLATESAVPCDFLKIPHHGVFNTEMENLAVKMQPKYTAICDSAKNPADASTVEVFKKYNANVLETKDGDIIVISNGIQVEVSQAGS